MGRISRHIPTGTRFGSCEPSSVGELTLIAMVGAIPMAGVIIDGESNVIVARRG